MINNFRKNIDNKIYIPNDWNPKQAKMFLDFLEYITISIWEIYENEIKEHLEAERISKNQDNDLPF
jgi:hypothetical protein